MFEGYQDAELVGEGGLGRVFRAIKISTGGPVAIKELRDVNRGSRVWDRAERELQALLRVKGHPYIVSVEEIIPGPSGPCLVMEYLPGGSLIERIEEAPLSPPEVVLVGQHVLSALGAAHDLGVIHRDIKPHNLMVGSFGQLKVCDFGISALMRGGHHTQTSSLTLAYASPEELDGERVGAPADVYSFCATILHLSTGERPTFQSRATGHDAVVEQLEPLGHELAVALAAGLNDNPGTRPSIELLQQHFDESASALGKQALRSMEVIGWQPAASDTIIVPTGGRDDTADLAAPRTGGQAIPHTPIAPTPKGTPPAEQTRQAPSGQPTDTDSAPPPADATPARDGRPVVPDSAGRDEYETVVPISAPPSPDTIDETPSPAVHPADEKPDGNRRLAVLVTSAVLILAFVVFMLQRGSADGDPVADPDSTEPIAEPESTLVTTAPPKTVPTEVQIPVRPATTPATTVEPTTSAAPTTTTTVAPTTTLPPTTLAPTTLPPNSVRTTSPPATSGINFRNEPAVGALVLGHQGPRVRRLQEALVSRGALVATGVDGEFGRATQDAVRAYQNAAGLGVDGVAGGETHTSLGISYSSGSTTPSTGSWNGEYVPEPSSGSLRIGHRGARVQNLQQLLISKGFLPAGSADGDFGPGVRNAVRQFQSANGLTVDGIAGPGTLAALAS